ncbi:MAG TPA: hypothetical protein VNS08_06355 [Ureibacillus sp.]|nr:hypothetical protein [Ureibacillus sp.]
MYKRILSSVALCLLIVTPVYAHLTGAFVDYLAVVYDDTTIEKLQQGMEETKQQIEELTPNVQQAEEAFEQNQQQAIDQLQFYSEVGLDTWLALMQQGTDIVDLQGNEWIMQYKIENYLDDLNALYLEYNQLLISQQTLEGHVQLLQAIEKNLQARQNYLDQAEGLELEVIANYLDIDWTSEVEEPIINDLQRDADLVKTNLASWVDSSNYLDEEWLNEQSNATYYFHQDHIYIEYVVNAEHVILLGQILQNDKGNAAQLVLEAGFYNGFYLPEELLVELPSFTLSYAALSEASGIEEPYVLQQNGGLQIQSK